MIKWLKSLKSLVVNIKGMCDVSDNPVSICSMTVNSIVVDGENMMLSRPLDIGVETFDDDSITVYNRELFVFSSGDSISDAITCFKVDVGSLYKELIELEYEEIGQKMRTTKFILQNIVVDK